MNQPRRRRWSCNRRPSHRLASRDRFGDVAPVRFPPSTGRGSLARSPNQERTREASDRRAIHVELSSAGLRAQRETLATVIAFARRLEAGFSKRGLDQPDEALDRLASNVGDAA